MSAPAAFIGPEALLQHWQGHRRLTRRVIEAFPEDRLFTYALGGMRPFGVLALEILGMGVPMIQGVLTETWDASMQREPVSKKEILRRWDAATQELDRLWPQIVPERFAQEIVAFGQFPGRVYDLLLYVIDNEVHHRGQGYVYLRTLGIEPPPFYERT